MVNYQKYMFDDFVVVEDDNKDVFVDDEQMPVTESEEVYEAEEIYKTDEICEKEEIEEVEEVKENSEEYIEQEVQNTEDTMPIDEIQSEFQSYNYNEEPQIIDNVVTYTEEEMKEAITQAEEVAYNKGLEEAKNSIYEKQNILLEDIKNQLMTIFASLEEKKSDLEISAMKFAVNIVEKIMPTIEREKAESEVKNFLAENFANFSSQEALSFSFNPDMLAHISDSIRRLAEQNDFEGKISVHKDITLGLSDCRVEWKSGGVERKTSNVMDKVKNLINIDNQERENG